MRAGSRSPGFVSAALPLGPVVSTANPALQLQDRIPGSREDDNFHWTPPGPSRWASLRRSRQPGRRSPGSSQGRSTSQPQQAARSLSLTQSHPSASGSPHLCPTLLTLHNSGPAYLGTTHSPGPGCLGSSLQHFLSIRWSQRPTRLRIFRIAPLAPGRMLIFTGLIKASTEL
ncbi:hypothetical protein NDU88_000872 [Pleurodeles waltl]|uniref:Uncharacterized protein n=1 Tax=Pleurodeles waltl TaxID=8319 RepID=A0AAV7SYC9_PLEWA|nr:hypothetical protein NDU88_000872 [Pleurodeles waltl]